MRFKKSIVKYGLELLFLILIICFAVWTRLTTFKSPTILDYDPWFYYRYAKEILENNGIPPKWDLLSFFPPGRPMHIYLGWPYTIIFFYKILSIFGITFLTVGKLSPVIVTGLSVIPAYLLGKKLSNEIGGLTTALFAIGAPTFIGVSMAGYCDTDAIVVFGSFLTTYSIILAIKKRKIVYSIFSSIVLLYFIYSWFYGWYVLFFFLLFIPGLIIFRLIETFVHEKKIKLWTKEMKNELRIILPPLLIILLISNISSVVFGWKNILDFILQTLGFATEKGLIVNVSVAELQPINIFTRAGFLTVAGRAGLAPTLFAFLLPVLMIYKIFKKEKINFMEIFLLVWMLITFYSIIRGVRFSLLFACAIATSAGYVIGNLAKLLKGKNIIFSSTFFGFLLLLIFMFISDAVLYSVSSSGMEVDQNWIGMLDWLKENADKKALVATWWDPGHIIAGYTGLRVHADGAHCSPSYCIPYNHNVRIQDMGRIMSTSNETEAIDILKKYKQLTPEQCEEVKQKFDGIVPEEACEPASEIYFISSNDLIGKFTWMNYFGGYRAPIKTNQDFFANPGVCCASTPKTEPGQASCGEFASQGRGVWVWCPWIFSFSKVEKDQQGNQIYLYSYSGLTMAIVQKGGRLIPIYNNKYLINHITFFLQGQQQNDDLSDLNTSLERINGLVWIDPNFRTLIYFAPSIKDSIFVRTFFYNGQGLKHFDLVYQNPEIKLYKVHFD